MAYISKQQIKLLRKVGKAKPSLQPSIQNALDQLKETDRTLEASSQSHAHSRRMAGSWSMNFAKVPLEKARAYAKQELNRNGMTLDEAFTDFDTNYQIVQDKVNKHALGIPRNRMPVIEPEEIKEFMEDLQSGSVDIFQPWAKGELYMPEGFSGKEEAEEWINLGLEDGARSDDQVRAKLTTMPSSKLKPTQDQIWFDKIIKNVIEFGAVDSSSPILDMTIIVSADGYLLDGHHRWAGATMGDPGLSQSVLHVPMDIKKLLEISRSYGYAMGNEPKH